MVSEDMRMVVGAAREGSCWCEGVLLEAAWCKVSAAFWPVLDAPCYIVNKRHFLIARDPVARTSSALDPSLGAQ